VSTVSAVALDGVTDLLTIHANDPARYPVLLESSGGTPAIGRFDILMAFPGRRLGLDERWRLSGPDNRQPSGDFLDAFDAWWQADRKPDAGRADDWPFRGGWFLFLAYEMACQTEPSVRLQPAERIPAALAIRFPAAVVRDRVTGLCHAVAEAGSADLLPQIAADARIAATRSAPVDDMARLIAAGSVTEQDPALFLEAAAKARNHIAAGDIYQANISRRWHARLRAGSEPWMLYARLRRANPAPFGGLALLGGLAIVSSSPERLLRVRDGRIDTRPIAGTRPRLAGESEDARTAELLTNPKERAEHVMLIDLERNDLGRVCVPGSIRVDEFMAIESYAHVHHIVSNVCGRLRAGTTPGAVLRAIFPGGTITGCPKVRCMSIIQELEKLPRGPYTGSMGYINHDGSCDFNILIRTISVQDDILSIAAGSGIVADSDPQREIEETRAKAKGLLLSLGEVAGA
jgi:anthranilate synthase component 1